MKWPHLNRPISLTPTRQTAAAFRYEIYSFWIPAIKLKYILDQTDQLQVDFKPRTLNELRSPKFKSEWNSCVSSAHI